MRGNERCIASPKTEEITVEVPIRIHNRYDVEIVDALNGTVKSKAYAENCICAGYWRWLFGTQSNGNRVYTGLFDSKYAGMKSSSPGYAFNVPSYGYETETFFRYLKFGDGNGEPSPSDEDLFHVVGSLSPTSTDFDYVNKNNYMAYRTSKYILTETQAIGATITEVGLFDRLGNLASHAMLKDMNGNPISINKTDTDIINFYATFYADISAMSPDVSTTGIYAYDYEDALLSILCGYNAFSAWGYGNIHMAAGYDYENAANQACLISYGGMGMSSDLQNKKITLTAPRMVVDRHNTGHGLYGLSTVYYAKVARNFSDGDQTYRNIPGIGLYSGFPWYPGTNITGEPIGTGDGSTKDFKTKFPRVTQCKVYVNGVERQNVTVDMDVPHDPNNMGLVFLPIDNNERAHAKFRSGEGAIYTSPYNNMYACPTPTHWGSGSLENYSNANAISLEYVGTLCPTMWYNPRYDLGITSVVLQRLHTYDTRYGYQNISTVHVWCKDNRNDEWIELQRKSTGNYDASFTVPAEYKHYKYWKIVGGYFWFKTDAFTECNIHFDVAPNEGDVITADYFTKNIAKDPDHVVDFSMTLTFGEPDRDV